MAREVEVRRDGQVIGRARVCGQDDMALPYALPAHGGDREDEVTTQTSAGKESCWKMNKETHKAALDALAELIRGELGGEDRARFSRVGRLAAIGQRLIAEMSPRAEDVDNELDIAEDELGMGGFYPPRRRRRGAIVVGPGDDQQQMVREALAMFGPAMGGLQQQNDAKRRESMAREWNELLEARARLETRARSKNGQEGPGALDHLTKRIDAILAAMADEEKPKGDEDGLSVVPAVDVRRHQAGPSLGGLDEGNPHWPLADGEGGGAGALREGDEAGRAPVVLGHGR